MIAVTASHAGVLAAIHAEAFPAGERWDDAAFAGLLATPGVFGWLDERGGLALARQAGGEAEILTLAVLPGSRRQGIGRLLLVAVIATVHGAPMFLEVAADNAAALALYASSGFAPCGRRRDYYGVGRDAVVLRGG